MSRLHVKYKMFQSCLEFGSLTLSYGKHDSAIIIKTLTYNAWLHVFHYPHNSIHHWICKLVSDGFFNQSFLYHCMFYCVSGSRAIRNNKATSAKVHSAIISNNTNKYIGQVVTVYLPKYWLARSR